MWRVTNGTKTLSNFSPIFWREASSSFEYIAGHKTDSYWQEWPPKYIFETHRHTHIHTHAHTHAHTHTRTYKRHSLWTKWVPLQSLSLTFTAKRKETSPFYGFSFLTLRIKGGRGTRQNEDIFICFVFEPQFVFCDQDWFLILVFFSLFRNHFLNENRFDNQVSSFTRCSIFLSHIFPWYFSQNFWVWFSTFG